MGSSAKKKKEKKKDFQKVKLKVGKAKPKPANYTDTSFRAKSIVLTQQSLSVDAPTVSAQCAHHLAQLSQKSDIQRRDSLAYLTTAIATKPPDSPLPQPSSVIVPAIQRFILDGSNAVRQQLLKLLQALPKEDIAGHSEQLLLHTRAGMLHLATDIRIFALDVLEYLLSVAGDEVVSCSGGWIKTLKCFLALLGWQKEAVGKWTAAKSFAKTGGDAKVQVKQMNVLTSFLRSGLIPSVQRGGPVPPARALNFPLWQVEHHMLSQRSTAFAYLNLFGPRRDEDSEMYEDREDRQRAFQIHARAAVSVGLEQAIKGGGELGRAGAQLRKVVNEGMTDYSGEEEDEDMV